jgi:hypothetical protein
MDDDLVTGGILPSGVIAGDDDDPNMVESDDFLDDPEDLLLAEVIDMPADVLATDDDDDDLLEE